MENAQAGDQGRMVVVAPAPVADRATSEQMSQWAVGSG